jgi:hypothetical protein
MRTGDDVRVAAALVVFFLLWFIAKFALGGKGVVSGKLAAILAILLGLWIVMAVDNLGETDSGVGWLAGGVVTLVHGFATLFGHFVG